MSTRVERVPRVLNKHPAAAAEMKTRHFLFSDVTLTALDHEQVNKLALLMTDSGLLAQQPTWEDRARYIGCSVDKLNMLRRTPQYMEALPVAAKLKAMEGVGGAVDNIAARAQDPLGDDPEKAVGVLAKIAGMAEGRKTEINITQNNLTLEQRLVNLVEDRVKVIEHAGK